MSETFDNFKRGQALAHNMYTELLLTSTAFNHRKFAPHHDLVHSSSTAMLQSGPCTLAEDKGAPDTLSKQAQSRSDIWKFILTH